MGKTKADLICFFYLFRLFGGLRHTPALLRNMFHDITLEFHSRDCYIFE